MSLYVKNALNKVSNMTKAAKWAYLSGNEDQALEMIKTIEARLVFIQQEIKKNQKVSA